MGGVTQETKDHCSKHKMCKGCPFAGGACVAPVSDHKFAEWIEEMNLRIAEHSKMRGEHV